MMRSFRSILLGLALVMTLGHTLVPHGHTAPDELCICSGTDAGASLIGALTRSFTHHNPGHGHLEQFQQQEHDTPAVIWSGSFTLAPTYATRQGVRRFPAEGLAVTQPAGTLPWFRGPPVS